MLASTTGSTNATGAPIAGSGTTPTSDKAPLVSKKNRLMRRVSGIFGTTEQATTQDGYVEFGDLDSSSVNVGFAGFADSAQRTLGTFAGVFSPVALSMFSALVFIRVGYIVGNAGLLVTLLQFLIAYGILVFTVASVCAISTNGAVEGGGAYFMISRTLGPEFGGSIGTLFFLANIVGSALCISGFSEAIVENFGPSGYLLGDGSPGLIPDGRWYRFLYCSILNTINLCVCLVGASTFAKTSVAILAVVSICLSSTFISFFAEGFRQIPVPDANELIQNATYKVNVTYTGLNRDTLMSNLYTSYGRDYTSSDGHIVSFAATFGVLFSGVTGIMAGANMSGELKSPARSIPSGTLSAVLFTFIIYVALSILTAATCSRELLQNNYMYMMPINIWPPFVSIGVMTATFSASLSNLIGSSRVLEALAKDRVFGSFLNFVVKGTWHSNPIAAVLVSWLLVQIMFFVGSLNAIAQINSVLFLLSYLATNMACLGLQLASAPNFRPSFKCFTWHTASVGLFGTIAMMFVINPVYSSCSIALCVALVACLHFFGSEVQGEGAPYWGSISQALIFHQVRKYLLLLDSRKDHVKYWRPQILLLVSNPRACCPLIDFVNDIKKGGLYVLGHVFVSSSIGDDISTINPDRTQEQYPYWLELVDHLKIKAFVELTEARSVREGFQHLVRISGMGAMKPNTVILGFYDDNIPIDFLTGETSYKTNLFDKTSDGSVNENVFQLRHRNEVKKYLDVPQYVSMIKDGLALGKNVCVCRHFDKLDKNALLKNSKIKYMDVWAVNALAPRSTAMAAFDTTALFMMQLAVICRMVGVWKRMAIRVYIATTDETVVHRLQELLKLLRIRATIHEVPNWSSATDLLQGESVMLNSTTNTYDFDTDNSETIDHYEDVHERSNTYKYLTRFNELIRLNSQNTAVTFLYMPAPPGFVLRNSAGSSDNSYDEFSDTVYGIDSRNNTQSRKSNNYDKLNKEYLNVLSILTEQLPPTVLVHGLNTVTSTTL